MVYKVVVAGYSQMFASIITGILDAGSDVVGVFRHERVGNSACKLFFKDYFMPSHDYSYIKNLGLYEIKAKSINSKKFKQEMIKLKADFLIIASWGEKLNKETIQLPKVACINVHPALLPKYRGPNPYLQVIKNQEKETGVTFHLMDENWDTGDILSQYAVPVFQDDTGKSLRLRCANVAKLGVCELLENYEHHAVIVPIKQDNETASYYPQITIDDLMIDFTNPSDKLSAQIRAIKDWQPCYIRHKNEFFEVKNFKILNNKFDKIPAGTIIKKGHGSFSVSTCDNKIIKFDDVRLYGQLGKLKTQLYLDFFVKNGDKLV